MEAKDNYLDWHEENARHAKPHWGTTWAGTAAVILWLVGIYFVFFSAPIDFPDGSVVRIRKGSSISAIASGLAEKNFIRHPILFKAMAFLSGGGNAVAGDYKFERPQGVIAVYERISRGVFGINPTRVTIFEGHNAREIAALLDKSLPAFERDRFIEATDGLEGKLFPDTYTIQPMDDEQDIVRMMNDNFERQITVVESLISKSGRTRDEIVTMASIIELEARTPESRRMVSGILWNRLRKGMKLQVDAVFPYIMGKYSLQLTIKDLQYDSPYNTYRYKGLPPGPISNPGLDSIKAALEPVKTDYLYYLSDRAGKMYYAKTYQGHMVNRAKYLGG